VVGNGLFLFRRTSSAKLQHFHPCAPFAVGAGYGILCLLANSLREFNDKNAENFNVVRQEAYPRQLGATGGAKDDFILCDR
jgi:hypothetical protein